MSKVRINDLARELEVKSKSILDTLPLVGVTEKKTHSSSLEEHEAEKVRVYIRSAAEGSSPVGRSSSRAIRGEEEIKTKIDLSHISRPGDVLKAITQKKEAVAPRPVPPPVAHAPVAHPPEEKPVVAPPVSRPMVATPPPPAAPVTAQPVSPVVQASPVAAPVLSSPAAAPPVRPAATPAVPAPPAPVPPVVAASAPPAVPVAPKPAAPQPPSPRMIVPQTGPRPVYKAPMRPASPPLQEGVPIGGAMRPTPGRPVPGQPIFQRRPPVPGGGAPRPLLRPGERRPMHPTRQAPAGARPLGVGPALPPPGTTRPGSRPGGPAGVPASATFRAA